MSNKKKKTKAALGLTGSAIDKYFLNEPQSAKNGPTVMDVINHNRRLAKEYIDSGDPRWEWEFVMIMADRAQDAFDQGDIGLLCFEIYGIGRYTENLELLAPEHQRRVAKLIQSDEKRQHALNVRNSMSKRLREMAQALAQREWRKDIEQKIRIGEMAETIWADLYLRITVEFRKSERKIALAALPNTAGGIKPWLRPVAPEYAKKGGPGKKK